MSESYTDEEQQDYFDPTVNGQRDETVSPDDEAGSASYVSYDALIDAPDYSTLVRGPRSRTAKEYETKVRSVLKSGAIGGLRHGQVADSAAIFRYGPAFSAAAGDLAGVSDQARRAIDLLTAPENPWIIFAAITFPFVSQLIRNHQPDLTEINATRKQRRTYRKAHPDEFQKLEKQAVTVNLPFGRKLTLRIGMRFSLLKGIRLAFQARTRPPEELITMVFSDKKLVAALKKQGIDIVQVKM